MDRYIFKLVLFWIWVYNIPLECMDLEIALKVGGTVGEMLAND